MVFVHFLNVFLSLSFPKVKLIFNFRYFLNAHIDTGALRSITQESLLFGLLVQAFG